jgi:hypothetical protein
VSLPISSDPKIPSKNFMMSGTGHKICSQKDENYVSESTALRRVKYLSVLSPFSGDKGQTQGITSLSFFHLLSSVQIPQLYDYVRMAKGILLDKKVEASD